MKEADPQISVIVPVYNTGKYLRKCIESVMYQPYENIELILVNDGSTDDSGEICDTYSRVDGRIKVVHQENCGAATSRNRGIEIAGGDYLMFLDSDDYWVPSCLDEIVGKMRENNDIEVMFLKCAVIKKDGTLTRFKGYEFDNLNREQLLDYISKQKKVAVSACLKIFKKELFQDKELYFQDSLLAEDIDWFFKLLTKAKKYSSYSGDFYCYRVLGNSASRSISERRIRDYLYILNKWVDYTNRYGTDVREKSQLYNMIGYEYEVLLATYFNYSVQVRRKYLGDLKNLFWLLKHRKGNRSRLIKLLYFTTGFLATCRILNFYLHSRTVK